MSKLTIKKIEKKVKGRTPKPIGRYSFFSVLVPLVEIDDELWVLYEIRSEKLTHQPGEVCFPGGGLEAGETQEEGAVRETCEELGIETSAIKILGQLDTLHTYSNFTMYSFLGVIRHEDLLLASPSVDEVKEYFLVPLDYLMETPPFVYEMDVSPNIGADFPYEIVNFDEGYNWRRGTAEIPIYTFEDKVIWGLTARITKNMVEIMKEKKL